MTKITTLVAIAMTTLVLLAGCSKSNSITSEEYAQLVCEKSNSTTETWRDLSESTQETLDLLERIDPPEEMRDYHEAAIRGARALNELAKGKPQEDKINPFELLEAPEALAAGMAIGNLPAEVNQILEAAGCTSESAGTTQNYGEPKPARTLQTIKENEPLEEREWYFRETRTENDLRKTVTIVAPRTHHQVTYECLTLTDNAYTYPRVEIRYPEQLPKDLTIHGYDSQPETLVKATNLPLMWQRALSKKDTIKLTYVEARILVHHIQEM